MTNTDLQIIVTTCDKYAWALRPSAYLFNTHWSASALVHVLCESPISNLPPNFQPRPISLPDNGGWPRKLWTDGLIKYLHSIPQQFVIIMLEDYWLTRDVNLPAIDYALEYMMQYRSILRVDLTTDRLYAGGVKQHDTYRWLDFVQADHSPYEMSLMPGLWNKKLLLDILEPGWSPWDVETIGTNKVNESEMVVLGTRQNPITFVNGMRDHTEDVNVNGIKEPHRSKVKEWIPTNAEIVDFPWHERPNNKPD